MIKKSKKAVVTGILLTALSMSLFSGCRMADEETQEQGTAISLQQEYADLYGIQEVSRLENGNYVVKANISGFDSTIEAKMYYDATAEHILSLEILSQNETEGLGSRITEEEFLDGFHQLSVPVTVTESDMKIIDPKVLKEIADKKQEQYAGGYIDGTYNAKSETASNGYTDQIQITIKNGKISDVRYDSTDAQGNTKCELSETGAYKMTDQGPTWAEQSKAFGEYIVSSQSTSIQLDDAGKTDAITGVSISLSNAVQLIDNCLLQGTACTIADGTYEASDEAFSNGYKGTAQLVIRNGKINQITYDMIGEDGTLKTDLSKNGSYKMTDDGLLWHEQIQNMIDYMITNQSITIPIDDSGKTDAVTGVSISLSDPITLLETCMAQAKSIEIEDNTAESILQATPFDSVTGATRTSESIAKVVNNGSFYLKNCVLH